MLEYHDRHWAARFAEGLMPKVANGIHLDANLGRAHAENMELEFHRALVLKQVGVLRLLAYVNHANMGSYRQAIDNFRRPDAAPGHYCASAANHDQVRFWRKLRAALQRLARRVRTLGLERGPTRIVCLHPS